MPSFFVGGRSESVEAFYMPNIDMDLFSSDTGSQKVRIEIFFLEISWSFLFVDTSDACFWICVFR